MVTYKNYLGSPITPPKNQGGLLGALQSQNPLGNTPSVGISSTPSGVKSGPTNMPRITPTDPGSMYAQQQNPTSPFYTGGQHTTDSSAGSTAGNVTDMTNILGFLKNIPQTPMPAAFSVPEMNYSPNPIGTPTLPTNFSDYSSRIQQEGDLATQAGLRALQEMTFKPQIQQMREQLAGRGLVGSGVENAGMQQMYNEQNWQANQFVQQQASDTMSKITQEMQAQRDMAFQSAVQTGNWQQAAQIHSEDMRAQTEQIRQQNEALKLQVYQTNNDATYKFIQSNLDQVKTALQARGQLTDEKAQDIEMLKFIASTFAQGPDGLSGEALMNAVRDQAAEQGVDWLSPADEQGGTLSNPTGEAKPSTPKTPSTYADILREKPSTSSYDTLIKAGGMFDPVKKTITIGDVVYYGAGNPMKPFTRTDPANWTWSTQKPGIGGIKLPR